MDSLKGLEDETGFEDRFDDEPAIERPPEIGTDERRMHVRAYNYWVSLLRGRPYPSIEDIDPASLEDFGPRSVLLDFSQGGEDPVIAYLGADLRDECGLDAEISELGDIPSRALLSRLTDHYMQILANRAPIGFEAEYVNSRGHNTLYRGILMPLSSDGEKIDFVYGVINWKELADGETTAQLNAEVDRALARRPASPPSALPAPVWADGPGAGEEELGGAGFQRLEIGSGAGLADRLSLARESAVEAIAAEARSRAALYVALGHAYDFALAAEEHPDEYRALLDDAGIRVQQRAPMTAVVKLVFGPNASKARLTEYAAALSYARREELPLGGMEALLETHPGGLKAVVAAERAARRPAGRRDAGEKARQALRR
ncbi:MAG: hypothetical protein ACFBQW_00325, partial [Sphingomonadaceae bacterium]